MTDPNRNLLWSRVITEELVRHGIDHACVTPGSRSTPLVTALQKNSAIRIFSHLDERSSSFFALGRARANGVPTPLVCTSGTAAANFHPAVLEAHNARVPMLLLTSDRPPELHDAGANQTVSQQRLYGDATRWFKQLPEPGSSPRKLRSLRVVIGQALQHAAGPPAGPVHLNVPFQKPLEPVRVPGDVPEDGARQNPDAYSGASGPFLSLRSSLQPPHGTVRDQLLGRLRDSSRPLLLAGPRAPLESDHSALLDIARKAKIPLLADPLSQLRFKPRNLDPICTGYETYLHPEARPGFRPPDCVLQVGLPLTAAKHLHSYLNRSGIERWVIDPAGQWKDPGFRSASMVTGSSEPLLNGLAEEIPNRQSDPWYQRWIDCETAYREHLVQDRSGVDFLFEGHLLWDVIDSIPEQGVLFVGNSLPIRDLDRYGLARDKPLRVLGNRGVSGIDGLTSTALGVASAVNQPLVAVMGDISFYHDMNGLLALKRFNLDATFVVINNDGGGIFHMLPVEQYDPPFTPYIKTPHGLEYEQAARMYGCQYHRVSSPGEWQRSRDRIGSPGRHLIEVNTDGKRSQRHREQIRTSFQPHLGERPQ